MLTVSQLARQSGISRATLLYYERKGLIEAASRGQNGYRWYGKDESERLQQILMYRGLGIAVTEIKLLLDGKDKTKRKQILIKQLSRLESEIQSFRTQQKEILGLIEQPQLLEDEMIGKDRWVEIMQAAGFSDDDMHNWHRQFEKLEPDAHQEFLESLSIPASEIGRIRNWAKE